jgi:uncharacterized iron-regulated protein
MKRIFFSVALLASSVCGWAQLSEANYRIYSVRLDKEVPLNVVAEDLINYDVLFLGEEHNDSVTHYIEKTLLALLYDKYPEVALSMEMFDRDVQPIMNEYLLGYIKEKQFVKDARAWSNYRDYRPMVEFAKENGIDVLCANAAGRYSNLAGRKGQEYLKKLPRESKEYFAPLPYKVATGKYLEKLTGVGEHSTGSDTAKAAAMPAAMGGFDLVTAQSLWDATMAYSIAEYKKKNANKAKKVMQVNGRFHSDEGFAVVEQLTEYNPKLKKMVVSTCSDESFPKIDWSKYKANGNYIIVTDPKVPRTYDN